MKKSLPCPKGAGGRGPSDSVNHARFFTKTYPADNPCGAHWTLCSTEAVGHDPRDRSSVAHAGFFTETYLLNLPTKVASIRTSRYSGAHRPTLTNTHNRPNTQTRLSALPPGFRSSSLVRVR